MSTVSKWVFGSCLTTNADLEDNEFWCIDVKMDKKRRHEYSNIEIQGNSTNGVSQSFEHLLRQIIREELTNVLAATKPEVRKEGPLVCESTSETALKKNPEKETKVDKLAEEMRNLLHQSNDKENVFKENSLSTYGSSLQSDDKKRSMPKAISNQNLSVTNESAGFRAELNASLTVSNNGSTKGERQRLYVGDPLESKKVFRKFPTKSYATLSEDDERECLSQALQANVSSLIDRLHFNMSYLPEALISSGQITEDECRMIRDDLSRKDQVRYLVSRTKGRDLKDIHGFLKIVEPDAPDIVKKIYLLFEENKRNGIKCTKCALCQFTNNLNIKDIIDCLWGSMVIPDGLYNEVVACSKQRGSQDYLWQQLIETCNSQPNIKRKGVYDELFKATLQRGNFEFIANPLKKMVEKQGILRCNCRCNIMLPRSDTDLTASGTTYYPVSSRRPSFGSTMFMESEVSHQNAKAGVHQADHTTKVATNNSVKPCQETRRLLERIPDLTKSFYLLLRRRHQTGESIEMEEILKGSTINQDIL